MNRRTSATYHRIAAFAVTMFSLACTFAHAADRELQKISDHVWMYTCIAPMAPATSYGANAGVIIGDRAVLVVDTLISAKQADALVADIRKLTPLPIKWVANTHYHLDHAWGSCVFEKQGATIIASRFAAKLMATKGEERLAQIRKGSELADEVKTTALAPATLTFDGALAIDLGGITVDLRTLPAGHCGDNLIVCIPDEKVIFAGDLMFVGCHPFMGEGDIPAWLKDLDMLASLGAEKIVPGHGRLANAKDIAEMKEYITIFDANATRLSKGKTQADVVEVAKELMETLPTTQGRDQMPGMLEYNLCTKYLPPAPTTQPTKAAKK